MENKDKKRIIILIAAFLIIISFNIYRNLPTNQIKRYISNRGFALEEDKTFYYKKISNKTKEEYEQDKANNISSNYDYLYFDIYNNILKEEINEYNDKYETSLNMNYNFSNHKLDFIYRTDYNNSKNIIFKGEYNEASEEYTCKKEFSNIDINNNKEDFCDNASYYVESFIEIKNKIFKNKKIIKYLENNK